MIGLELRDVPLLVEVAVAVATAVGGVWAWLRYVWPRLQATGRALAGLMDLGTRSDELTAGLGRMAAMEESLRAVRHEVLPNAGSSLRDAVTRTEATVSLIVAQQRARDDAEDEVVRLDLDADGRVTWLAAAMVRWTERSVDDLRGHGWLSFVHPEDREDVSEELFRCIRLRRNFDGSFRMIDRSGAPLAVRMSAVPVAIRVGMDEQVRWTATMKRIAAVHDALSPPDRQSRAL